MKLFDKKKMSIAGSFYFPPILEENLNVYSKNLDLLTQTPEFKQYPFIKINKINQVSYNSSREDFSTQVQNSLNLKQDLKFTF